jgi:hypothetical protein
MILYITIILGPCYRHLLLLYLYHGQWRHHRVACYCVSSISLCSGTMLELEVVSNATARFLVRRSSCHTYLLLLTSETQAACEPQTTFNATRSVLQRGLFCYDCGMCQLLANHIGTLEWWCSAGSECRSLSLCVIPLLLVAWQTFPHLTA